MYSYVYMYTEIYKSKYTSKYVSYFKEPFWSFVQLVIKIFQRQKLYGLEDDE